MITCKVEVKFEGDEVFPGGRMGQVRADQLEALIKVHKPEDFYVLSNTVNAEAPSMYQARAIESTIKGFIVQFGGKIIN